VVSACTGDDFLRPPDSPDLEAQGLDDRIGRRYVNVINIHISA
jgi:hypothetical protein